MNAIEMSNADYHATPAISKSHLDIVAVSPLHYHANYIAKTIERKESAIFVEGSLAHSLVLEPHKTKDEFAIVPMDINRRTKAGREEFAAWELEHQGMQAVTEEQILKCTSIAEAVHNHPAASWLISNGMPEQSFFWKDKETGLDCKCRPDWLRNDGIIVDLKTTNDASPHGFAKSIANFRYHVQHHWYANGAGAERFVFVCVEKTPPYAVAVYELDYASIVRGGDLARRNLNKIAECRESNEWRGYEGINSISLPAWAMGETVIESARF